jgi:FKBP-type peptidyl-prolyl cis-trans isomerase SlyD
MVVTLAYRLFDERGKLVDTRTRLTFVHGYAQVVPGLESGIVGMRVRERRTLRLSPEEAFGERDETARMEIDRDEAPGLERAKPGDELLAADEEGQEIPIRVVEVTDDEIIADLNHPLAGQNVRFEVEVVAVRAATDAELDGATAEAEERIVDDGAIGYGSEPPLIQLRRKPTNEDT